MPDFPRLNRRQTIAGASPLARRIGTAGLIATVAALPAAALAQTAAPAQGMREADLWSGAYAGVTAGYEWSNRSGSVTTSDPQGSLVDPSGLTQAVLLPSSLAANHSNATVGIDAGYNQRIAPHVLFGGEVDVNLGGTTSTGTFAGTFNDPKQPVPAYTSLSTLHTRTSWLSTARARLGFTTGPLLGFATAGLALGRVRSDATLTISNTGNPPSDMYSGSRSQTRAGYVLGGGGELAVSRDMSVKLEYLYYRLASVNYVAGPDTFTTTDQPGVSQGISYRPIGQIVRLGVNFRFR